MISLSALQKYSSDYIFDQNYKMWTSHSLSAALSKVRAMLVIHDTALSLLDADHVYTQKPELMVHIVQFPACDVSEVEELF
ncbi:hypothetical protein HK096_010850 [Nowakowskiella sp. JEL0078]|nr:hypothetical protein HK096_010850 [Nowakowskiella sp. JEL0078]